MILSYTICHVWLILQKFNINEANVDAAFKRADTSQEESFEASLNGCKRIPNCMACVGIVSALCMYRLRLFLRVVGDKFFLKQTLSPGCVYTNNLRLVLVPVSRFINHHMFSSYPTYIYAVSTSTPSRSTLFVHTNAPNFIVFAPELAQWRRKVTLN